MNTPNISPDDPQLTAYALGELEEAERLSLEAQIESNPELQAAVAEIRETATQLESVLAAEPLPEVEAAQDDPYRAPKGKLLHFPQLYYVVGTLAAACFAVLVVIHEPQVKVPATEESYYTEVTLPAAMPTVADAVGESSGRANEARAKILLVAPEAAPSSVDGRQKRDDEALVHSPFDVSSDKDFGYLKSNPQAETKIGMEIQGVVSGASAGKAKKESEKLATGSRGFAMSAQVAPGRRLMMKKAEMEMNTENYAYQQENGFKRVADHPLSTFSIDVDTASYANVRRFLNNGQRPPVDAVRIEELVNYFPYDYAAPTGDVPFAASMEVASAPWAPEHRLVRIGLKGREVSTAARPAANLVFLLDASGSMRAANKLPLVKQAMRLLVERLRADDRVAIVTYAGSSGLALASTPAKRAAEILHAMDVLTPGGSTNGAMGIQLAYDIAKANFVPGGINRVILCTDGDFNVGVRDEGGLTRLIEEKAKSKVFLTVLGFGMGNYQDANLERLADKGNGNYGYIDNRREAEKMLVEQVNGTLVTIAKDVKIQVEFNPLQVQAYRLIGYENRLLQKEDFNNDQIDAGEIGAGHTVTALYEVVPVGVTLPEMGGAVDALKYQTNSGQPSAIDQEQRVGSRSEMLTLKVRFKQPTGDVSSKLEFPLVDQGAEFIQASSDFKFATAVAGFGMLLRDSEFKGTSTWLDVGAWARDGLGNDKGGYRYEFLGLITKAQLLIQ